MTVEHLGPHQARTEDALGALIERNAVTRIWGRDTSLWGLNDAHAKVISNRLGWLSSVEDFTPHLEELQKFSSEVNSAGIETVVLLGMGGSSMCPEVLAQTIGPVPGYPKLKVLDTTDPGMINRVAESLDLKKTLFIVATKSGTTIETLSLFEFFWAKLNDAGVSSPGEHFAAITDPGSKLEALSAERGFRHLFSNPADIGGRYSALSYFGLVPAALLGIDLPTFLSRAAGATESCLHSPTEKTDRSNCGLTLGAFIGANALAGRDKLTLVFDDKIAALGAWIEQLVAESLGKQGKGVIPIDREPISDPANYGDDRCFVGLQLADSDPSDHLLRLADAGFPVLSSILGDTYDLASEFFRWEFATALAGVLLEVDPFDEPNVQETKDNTSALLKSFIDEGELPAPTSTFAHPSDVDAVREILRDVKPGDYVAINAYVDNTPEASALIAQIRKDIIGALGVATTHGWGPRFLHSTGQLHKGGTPNGLFIQITSENPVDLDIPGQPFTFGILQAAQAQGDLEALTTKGRHTLRVHTGEHLHGDLHILSESVRRALFP